MPDRKGVLRVGVEPYQVWAQYTDWGSDLQILIGGGTAPHIGAVGLAYPYEGKIIAEIIERPHHKEGELAKKIAGKIASSLQKTVAVSIGIHIDRASKDEIMILVRHAESLIPKLITALTDKKAGDREKESEEV